MLTTIAYCSLGSSLIEFAAQSMQRHIVTILVVIKIWYKMLHSPYLKCMNTLCKHRMVNMFHVYLLYLFKQEQWLADTISSQTTQNVRVVVKKTLSGTGHGIYVPVLATPSLFNTSCNSQGKDTTAVRMPPQLSDPAVVLSRPTAYYMFLKTEKRMMCKVYSESLWGANRGLAADSK